MKATQFFKCIAICGILFFRPVTYAQDTFPKHLIQYQDNLESIAEQYSITLETLKSLNPNVTNPLTPGKLLRLPDQVFQNPLAEVTIKRHRVKRKETLFSIAQRYNVTQDAIKKYNKELYSRQIRKGERLQIPIPVRGTPQSAIVQNNLKEHLVKPKETRYGIARLYGISVNVLDSLNPLVPENFPIGTILKVPQKKIVSSPFLEEDLYEYYEVLPKEGFFRLKIKLGLSKEEIIALNPYAANGLQVGMVLKVPKKNTLQDSASQIINLEDNISNFSTKEIALMLPLQLSKVPLDSLEKTEKALQKNRNLQVALDFYTGAQMAVAFAKELGISVKLNVYDTEANQNKVSQIINGYAFKNTEAVVGPLLKRNVEQAARVLQSKKVPVFSPLTNRPLNYTRNLYQTLPDNKQMEVAMLQYLQKHGNEKNIVIVTDSSNFDRQRYLLNTLPQAKLLFPKEKSFLLVTDMEEVLSETQTNWVLIDSEDAVIISNVIALLIGADDTRFTSRLFALNRSEAFQTDLLSNDHLARLQFTFPTSNKPYEINGSHPFVISYQYKYEVPPSKYAIRGFDVMYDVILRLASAESLEETTNNLIETQYVESKFRYAKKAGAGYQNQAFYIIQFTSDLSFKTLQ